MAVIDTLVQQILAQNTTDKWTGQGYGSAEANAKAMAKLLADAGITDIKQFGKVDKYEPVEVTAYTLNGNTVQRPRANLYYEEIPEWSEGNGWTTTRRDLTPAEIAQVKTNYGIVQTDSDGMVTGVIPATSVVEKDGKLMGVTGQTFGNKVTGEAIESGTGRWQNQRGEGLFGGTGEGEGNTAFRVDFTPDGTPVFYTTQGTSNDLAMLINDLGPIGSMAANYLAFQFGGPAGVAALNAAQGKSAEDVAKSALLAYAGGEFSKAVSPYIPAPDIPVDFVGGTTESINDALQQQFVSDLKAAGVGNVSEFINNVGGNAGSFVPSEAAVVASPIETVQVSAPSAPTLSDVISSIVTQQPVVTPTEITAPIETVQVAATQTPVTSTIADIVSAIIATPQTPVEPTVENVEVTSPTVNNDVVRTTPSPYDYGSLTQEQYNQIMGGGGPESNVINYDVPEGGYEGGSEGGGEVRVPTLEVTAPTVTPTSPPVAPTIADVISAIVSTPSTTDMVVTGEAPKPVEPEQPVIPVIPPTEMVVTGERPITNEAPSTITNEVTPAPIINAPPIDTKLPDKTYTTKEIIDMVRLGMLGASVLGAGAAATQDSGPTGFDIVPVPTEWTPPQATKVADFTPLTPIDFGTKDLLKGTQWEQLLSPTYGQIPAPMQFNQPSDMSYDRLMSILGSGRDTLPSQALTINDVISGIQNQYGQTPTSSMG